MKVGEILTAITKIREQKLLQNQKSYNRTRTPISIPPHLSKRTTPIPTRSQSPCVCESSYILPKTRTELRKFVDSRKYHQMMEYKLDAAQLMCDTFHKYKKRMFYLLERCVRVFDENVEISFKQNFKRISSPPVSTSKSTGMLYSPAVSRNNWNEALGVSHSPSFTDHSQLTFSYQVNYSEALPSIKHILSSAILKQKRRIFSEIFEIFKKSKRTLVLSNLVKVLTKSLYQALIERLKTRNACHKRTWEVPLKFDIKRLQLQQKKSETIQFSSADESEVHFEPNFETSSQYTSRYQQSIERNVRDLNLSSIASSEERIQTERTLNFTRTRHPATLLIDKPSYEFSDSSLDCRSKIIRVSRIDFPRSKVFSKAINKSCVLVSLVFESHLKGYTFEKIKIYCRRVVMKSRYRSGFHGLGVLIASKLGILFVKIHNITAAQDRIERLMLIVKSQNSLAMLKGFAIWKMVRFALIASRKQKILDSSVEYLRNTKRSLRNITGIIRNKIQLSSVYCFYKISSYSEYVKRRKSKCFFMIMCIKRLSMSIQYKSMRNSFDVIMILNKETTIKLLALDNIFKNVNKDLEFRLKICFSHWKLRVSSMKNLYLVCLSFLQIVGSVFMLKRRQYFKILKTTKRTKITLNSKKKLIELFRILKSYQSLSLYKYLRIWKFDVKRSSQSFLKIPTSLKNK